MAVLVKRLLAVACKVTCGSHVVGLIGRPQGIKGDLGPKTRA